MVFSPVGTYLPPLWGQPWPIETACVWGNLLGSPDQQITRGRLLVPGVGAFVRWSLVLGALPGKMGEFHFSYVCMCLYGSACVVGVFRQRVDSMIPCDFSRRRYCYFVLLLPCLSPFPLPNESLPFLHFLIGWIIPCSFPPHRSPACNGALFRPWFQGVLKRGRNKLHYV